MNAKVVRFQNPIYHQGLARSVYIRSGPQGAHNEFPRYRNCQLFLRVSYVRRGLSPPTALRRLWRMPIKFGLEEFAALEKVFVSAKYVTLKHGMSPGRLSYNYH